MIAVISTANDSHFQCVAEELRRMGKDARLVELHRLGNGARLSMSFGGCSQKWSDPGRAAVDFDDVECIWYRRPYPAVLVPPLSAKNDGDWAIREWREAVTSVLMSSKAYFVSNPWAQQLAAMKVYQLRLAQEEGLQIPDTVMTNDADVARAFVRKHRGRVIHKCVKSPRDRWVPTNRWQDDDDAELHWLYMSPTFFQEEIVAPHELRITLVGRELFAARFPVPVGVTDARPLLDLPYVEHRLPDDVASRLLALMTRLELRFGTIDMRQREDGSYVFLEVNPQGQFLFVEIKTGMPITRAVAELLARGGGPLGRKACESRSASEA